MYGGTNRTVSAAIIVTMYRTKFGERSVTLTIFLLLPECKDWRKKNKIANDDGIPK